MPVELHDLHRPPVQLAPDGVFSLASQTIGTIGVPGGPFTAGYATSPNRYCTYEIDTRGRIRLMFASGKTQISTFAIQTNHTGHPDPAHAGVMIGNQNFYPPPS